MALILNVAGVTLPLHSLLMAYLELATSATIAVARAMGPRRKIVSLVFLDPSLCFKLVRVGNANRTVSAMSVLLQT